MNNECRFGTLPSELSDNVESELRPTLNCSETCWVDRVWTQVLQPSWLHTALWTAQLLSYWCVFQVKSRVQDASVINSVGSSSMSAIIRTSKDISPHLVSYQCQYFMIRDTAELLSFLETQPCIPERTSSANISDMEIYYYPVALKIMIHIRWLSLGVLLCVYIRSHPEGG